MIKVSGVAGQLGGRRSQQPQPLHHMVKENARGERTGHPFPVLPQAPQDAWAAELLVKAIYISVIWLLPVRSRP
jgi:hypothetical protein